MSSFSQHVRDCDLHANCTIIVGLEGAGSAAERQVWESHADSGAHVECRANPGHPLFAADGRRLDGDREPCAVCRARFN